MSKKRTYSKEFKGSVLKGLEISANDPPTSLLGVYTYYYEDYESKSNIVITSSQEAGTNVYYNYKGQVFKVKLDDIGIRYISNINSFNSLKNNIVSTSKNINMEYIDLSLLVVPIKNETISPEGYTNTMRYFRGFAGGEYTDELISSATIRGYNCQVFEDKTLDLREINRHVALAGDALGLVLSILSMPKSVSIALGIVTFYKNGKEFLKYSYTILKYRGTESFRRDATVNGGTYHQVQKRYVYTIWENDNNYDYELEFGDEDPYFNNPRKLMEIAVDNYF